jgi:6-phosphogluconate dehydrogenase
MRPSARCSNKHAEYRESKGIEFVDCVTNGGVCALKEGYSLMIGGKPDIVERLRPIFETPAPAADKGWGHVGPHGAGN